MKNALALQEIAKSQYFVHSAEISKHTHTVFSSTFFFSWRVDTSTYSYRTIYKIVILEKLMMTKNHSERKYIYFDSLVSWRIVPRDNVSYISIFIILFFLATNIHGKNTDIVPTRETCFSAPAHTPHRYFVLCRIYILNASTRIQLNIVTSHKSR